MTKWKPYIISGVCVCGHSYEDHHLGLIMNSEILAEIREQEPNHPPYLPQECEYFGCNETGGLDTDGNIHCDNYQDKDNKYIMNEEV